MNELRVSPHAPRSELRHRGLMSLVMRAVIAIASGIAWSLPLVGKAGTGAAGVGAGLGALTGQLLGARRLRMAFALPVFGIAVLLAWVAAEGVTGTRVFAESMGPGAALAMGSSLRAGVIAFAVAGSLRLAAVKRPQLGALELVVASVGIALIFAGHRDGVVARPLWFADWAAERDLDAKLGLMFIGGFLALTVCIAAALETRRPWAMVALLPLAIVGLLFVSLVDARDLPQPQAANDLGLTDPNIGLPPIPDQNENSGENPSDPARGQGQGSGERQEQDPLQEALRGGGRGEREGQGGGGRAGDQGQGGGQGGPSQTEPRSGRRLVFTRAVRERAGRREPASARPSPRRLVERPEPRANGRGHLGRRLRAPDSGLLLSPADLESVQRRASHRDPPRRGSTATPFAPFPRVASRSPTHRPAITTSSSAPPSPWWCVTSAPLPSSRW